jgi:hypothetical protein
MSGARGERGAARRWRGGAARRWRGGAALGAAVAAALGCVSDPAYSPPSPVVLSEDAAGGALVTGRTAGGLAFGLRFAGGPGFHFPDQLLVDGADVLGHAPSPSCVADTEAGVVIAPTPRIGPRSDAPVAESRLVPTLRGPAIAQVRVEWGTTFSCDPQRAPRGSSTFTLSPDGRIARHDRIFDEVARSISPANCTCVGPGSLFRLSTFWALAADRYPTLHLAGEGPRPIPREDGLGNESNKPLSCVAGAGHEVAFAWLRPPTGANVGANIRGGPGVVAFERELVNGLPSLRDFTYTTSSQLVLGKIGCPELLDRASDLSDGWPVTIAGVSTRPSQVDGIYGGDDGTGATGVEVPAGRFEVVGATPTGFAVWLRFPRPTDGVRAQLATKTGAWYLPQQVDPRTWIVWFRDPLALQQVIAIEPL